MASPTKGQVPPPRWTRDEFIQDRAHAVELFRIDRMGEPLEKYGEAYEQRRDAFDELMELTVDLTELRQRSGEVLSDPAMMEVVRYLAGPPISSDDLRELADTTLARTILAKDAVKAHRIVDTVLLGLDSRRFPWLKEGREATDIEREVAAVSTCSLIAAQRVRTDRANESGGELEEAVAQVLEQAGFTRVAPRDISTTDDAPGPGEFCGESQFGTRKADLVIRLWDRRIMAVECKVSNSSTNSIKRLNNDAAVKAKRWIQEFGERTAVPAAVIAGVFKLKNLQDAQGDGLTILWGHNLDALVKFVDSTRY